MPISDGELYNSLKGRLAGADEGLILVDMQGWWTLWKLCAPCVAI